jgi:glycosyltransferase involved in cell wall biosynthesis
LNAGPVILLVQDLDGGGGMETVLRRQLPCLSAKHSIRVIAYTMPDDLSGDVTWTRVPRLPGPGWVRTLWFALIVSWRLPAVRRESARLHRQRPTVWSTGGLVLNHVDVISLHFLHSAFIRDNGWAPGQQGLRRLNAAWARLVGLALERLAYSRNRGACYAAVSAGLARDFADHYPGRKCVVTVNGVDHPHGDESSEPRRDGPLRAIFVGGDWVRKGLPTVLDAVAQTSDVHLTVVGEGPGTIGPKAVERMGIAARVAFLGWQDEVTAHLRDADVFVFPSQYETFGLAAFEAAAAGLAVIATPVGAIPELVIDGETGILVPKGDSRAIAAAFERLSSDPELCVRLGVSARERVSAFSWEASVESVDRVLSGGTRAHRETG